MGLPLNLCTYAHSARYEFLRSPVLSSDQLVADPSFAFFAKGRASRI
jgi:hypothetical protein